jgi:glucose/arabinose dehydrogenase
MRITRPRALGFASALALAGALLPGGSPAAQQAAGPAVSGQVQAALALPASTRGNPACPGEDVAFNPDRGQDVVLPRGYRIQVFASNLNFPTGLAFARTGDGFQALVVESGTGLPGRCNDNSLPEFGGKLSPGNPLTPDLLFLDRNGRVVRGPLFKPTSTDPAANTGYQPDGPAIGITFADGGRLFVTDSNQGVRGAPGTGNNTSRIMRADPATGRLSPFITGLPTGDHPTEELQARDGWLYWSQGSATNSGVTGHDNGGGGNQHDIACQDVTLSSNLFPSGDGHLTSGYSNHGVQRPGARVPAFEDATQRGMCTGAVLRARVGAEHPERTIQPFSWGYRNPFGIRFAPADHALRGNLFVTENGEDERGARPTNNSPDRLQLAAMNPDGTPDYHGWPDRFGDLDSTQALYNPQGGPGDDECGPPSSPGSFPACVPTVIANHTPVQHVMAFPPQQPTGPLALEPSDVAVVQPDFAPDSFTHGVVRRGAALVAREGDFGFSPENGSPGEGHDVQLVNFSRPGLPLQLQLQKFAFNCPAANQAHYPDGSPACKANPADLGSRDVGGEEAFPDGLRGINRPIGATFGPDGALYVVDYGAVRDFGRSDPATMFKNPADSPLVQIPHTGVIWRITRTGD